MVEQAKPLSPSDHSLQPAESLIASGICEEPFPCPTCGQMLAPTVRVCVACKRPIDRAEIKRTSTTEARAEDALATPPLAFVRFPWGLFFALLGARFLAALSLQQYFGLMRAELALGILEIVSASWVFFDAREKGIPKPFRWALGSLFLWIIIFPWYLKRRRSPGARCLFVEAETGPATRALIVVLVFLFLLAAFVFILKSPPPQ
jgi:hypothetical protein